MSNLHQIFYQHLEQELAVANTLNRLLCEERELLDPPKLEALSDLQDQKQAQLALLQQLTKKRCSLLEEHQVPLDKHCYKHPIFQSSNADDNDKLAALWQELADLFIENHRLTEVLSAIVLSARHRTQNLMNILRGQKNAPNLYDKSGQAKASSAGIGYAKA